MWLFGRVAQAQELLFGIFHKTHQFLVQMNKENTDIIDFIARVWAIKICNRNKNDNTKK